MDKIEVVRVLVYRGPREQVERTLKNGGVPPNCTVKHGAMTITSKLLDDFPLHVETPDA